MSKADGTFVLRIPKDNSSYVVTYCATSYDIFTNAANDNVTDGTDIDPVPVKLFPVGGGADAMRASLENLRADTRRETLAAQASSDAATFTAAVQSLPAAEQALVRAWTSPNGGGERPQLQPPEGRAPRSLQRITSSVRTTLTYFATASPKHFRTEVQRFDDISDYVRAADIRPEPKVQIKSLLPAFSGSSPLVRDAVSRICEKQELLRALAYLYYGSAYECDGHLMSAEQGVDTGIVDRPTLLGLLSSPSLGTQHVFYPRGATKLERSLDWEMRRTQFDATMKEIGEWDGMVFMVATATNDDPSAKETATVRMLEMGKYLRASVRVPCRATRAVRISAPAMRLNESDAARLSIQPYEYRLPSIEDEVKLGFTDYNKLRQSALATLNEAVHIIHVPCSPETLFATHRELIWFHYRAAVSVRGPEERSRNEHIARVLLSGDTTQNQKAFLDELCAYCRSGAKPTGTPADATSAEACLLVKEVGQHPDACDSVPTREH